MTQSIEARYFLNKTWLISGRLPNMPKKETVAAIKHRGGRVVSAVSGQLDYVVTCGVTPKPSAAVGQKAQDAIGVGATVIGEWDFLRLLDGNDPLDRSTQPALSPLPPELAAVHYPGPEVDINTTYFKGKRWWIYGTLIEGQRILTKGNLEYRAKGRMDFKTTRNVAQADFVAYEGDTPLWGAHLPEQVQEARDRGVPIVGVTDFLALLDGERPTPPSADEPTVHDGLGELRALLHEDGLEAQDRWPQIQALLDRLDDDAIQVATDYINAFLDRLPPQVRQRIALVTEHDDANWLRRAMQGENLPAFKVVRTIGVYEKLTGAQAAHLLACTHFERCERFTLSTSPPTPQKSWTLFAQAHHLGQLTALELSNQRLTAKSAQAIAQAEHLQGLVMLGLHCATLKKGAPEALFAPLRFPHIVELDARSVYYEGTEFYDALRARQFPLQRLKCGQAGRHPGLGNFLASTATTGLRTLFIEADEESLNALARSPTLDTLEHLKIAFVDDAYRDHPLWNSSPLRSLKRLDIRLVDRDGAFFERLCSAPLAEHLEELEVYSWSSEPFVGWTAALPKATMPRLRRVRFDAEPQPGTHLAAHLPSLEREEYTLDCWTLYDSTRAPSFRTVIEHTH
ncbi:MAG: BRCT domain-containing protein [Myxococcota bacterium]